VLIAVLDVLLDVVFFIADVLSIFDVVEWLWRRLRPDSI
jgi:hypothetical protein